MKELLKISEFKELLYQMKPWGNEALKLIDVKMSLIDESGEVTDTQLVLKLIYRDNQSAAKATFVKIRHLMCA